MRDTGCDSEQWFQLREDDIPDVIADAFERLSHRGPACWPFLGERYVKGDAVVELHFRLRSRRDHMIAGEFHAILKSAVSDVAMEMQSSTRVAVDTNLRTGENTPSSQQMAMFVHYLHFVEQEQRVRFWRVPSVVRLQRLNGSLDDAGSLSHGIRAPAHIVTTVVVDGKQNTLGFERDRRVLENQTPDQVIQGDAVVVQAVADDVQPFGGLASLDADAHDFVTRLRIVLADNFEWVEVEEGLEGCLEAFQMHICPIETTAVVHRTVP